MTLMDNIPNTLGKDSHSEKKSTQVDCHKRRTFRQNLPGGLLDETRLPAEFFEQRLLVLVDISHTVGHQDYTDRHITHCQASGLHC